MDILQNKSTLHINGYLEALSDINGKQKEFYTRLFLVEKNENSIEEKVKKLLDVKENIKVVEKKSYLQTHIQYFLEKLILFKPFSGLYEDSQNHIIPNNLIKEYQDYIIFHLSDYLDFALEEENIKYPYKSKIDFILLEKNGKSYIVLTQTVEDRELIWIFWQHFYNYDEVKKLFLEVKTYCDVIENKKKVDKEKTKDTNYLNGLSEEASNQLIVHLPIIQEQGYHRKKYSR